MADRAFADHAVELLTALGPVRSRGMFGGFGIYLDDVMFGLVAHDRLYLKIDDETRERFREAGGEPFSYEGKDKPIEMSYWTPPDEAADDPEALLPWAELALEAARRAKARKPRRPRKRRTRGSSAAS